jgi:hypothetical protein
MTCGVTITKEGQYNIDGLFCLFGYKFFHCCNNTKCLMLHGQNLGKLINSFFVLSLNNHPYDLLVQLL